MYHSQPTATGAPAAMIVSADNPSHLTVNTRQLLSLVPQQMRTPVGADFDHQVRHFEENSQRSVTAARPGAFGPSGTVVDLSHFTRPQAMYVFIMGQQHDEDPCQLYAIQDGYAQSAPGVLNHFFNCVTYLDIGGGACAEHIWRHRASECRLRKFFLFILL
jgi:hypothetical protein